jgi:hypothetical protein
MTTEAKYQPQSVYKFYFLEYFYVLFKSIESYSNRNKIFESFKNLKDTHKLGESKYKRITFETDNLTKTQEDRYLYTFEQVISEAEVYGLIIKQDPEYLALTGQGRELLDTYQESGLLAFNRALFKYMEAHYNAFSYLVKFCYASNKKNPGLLIFPNYSPLKLQIERSRIRKSIDIIYYSEQLTKKLEKDIFDHLGEERDLGPKNINLIDRLRTTGLIPENGGEPFEPKKYNAIIKRFRDFWLNYFLKEIYQYSFSLHAFDIWVYRGKQLGIIHATEFYPNFNGRIVYPTSVITDYNASQDFQKIFTYNSGQSLFVHSPNWDKEDTQESFIKALTNAYFDIRKSHRSYFVSLADVRELVCYNLKIPEYLFDDFLKEAYKLNIKGQLNINFSLEADKLPQETSAIYMKREPIMIDERYRNIIAIDITKGDRQHGKVFEKAS